MKYALKWSYLGGEFDYEVSRHETSAEAKVAGEQALQRSIAAHGIIGGVIRDPQYIAYKRLDGETLIFTVEEVRY